MILISSSFSSSNSIEIVDDNALPQTNSNVDTATDYSVKRPRNLRFTPRTLQSKPNTKSANGGAFELQASEFVEAQDVKSGDIVAAANVAGCTAVFFWNKENMPSAWHFDCGTEATDGKTAAQIVGAHQEDIVAAFIVAANDANFDTLKTTIKAHLTSLKDTDFTKMIYDVSQLPSNMVYRYMATAGTIGVKQSTEPTSVLDKPPPQ